MVITFVTLLLLSFTLQLKVPEITLLAVSNLVKVIDPLIPPKGVPAALRYSATNVGPRFTVPVVKGPLYVRVILVEDDDSIPIRVILVAGVLDTVWMSESHTTPSTLAEKAVSAAHAVHGPPQSIPVSPWFWMPSEQVAAGVA